MKKFLPTFAILFYFCASVCGVFLSNVFTGDALFENTRIAQAQSGNIKASDLVAHSEISVTPKSGIFTEGSTFEVPIYINTKGHSINAIALTIGFDAKKLSIVSPSGGKSIIGLWVQPPSYDNVKGTVTIVGTIPGGITTNSGLVVTVTFQAKATGRAEVNIKSDSSVLLNDGLGSATILDSSRGVYEIVPKPPEGVHVFSDTHPFQDRWYNNNSPTVAWDIDPGVTAFSYVLDTNPNTVPDNTQMGLTASKSFEKMKDGLWYFHIKAFKAGGWSTTNHFLLRIDTTPPAEFSPTVGYVTSSDSPRSLVSFFTTDGLSGIDRYEIGVIDKVQAETSSPVFIETESPYQLPSQTIKDARVIIRAFDHAGNVREGFADIAVPKLVWKFLTDNKIAILLGGLGLFILFLLFHYLFGHHILRHTRNVFRRIKREEKLEELKELEEEIREEKAEELLEERQEEQQEQQEEPHEIRQELAHSDIVQRIRERAAQPVMTQHVEVPHIEIPHEMPHTEVPHIQVPQEPAPQFTMPQQQPIVPQKPPEAPQAEVPAVPPIQQDIPKGSFRGSRFIE